MRFFEQHDAHTDSIALFAMCRSARKSVLPYFVRLSIGEPLCYTLVVDSPRLRPYRAFHGSLYLLTGASRFQQTSLNFDDPTLKSLLKALPEAPAMAQRQCLQRCGLYKGDNKTYDSGDGDKR